MRLFIAIELEKNIRVYIESIQSQFKGLGQFSFPKQENFHITLKFFLELQDPSVVKRDLNNVKFEPFELKLSEVSYFGSENEPRVLWVGIDKSKDLYALRRAVDNVIYCHEPDSAVHDQFKGHITLARIKSIDDLEKFKATVENVDVDSHIIPVQEFVLMKSELLNTGPKYVVLARFKAKTA